jgi:hypothetical protein
MLHKTLPEQALGSSFDAIEKFLHSYRGLCPIFYLIPYRLLSL